LFPSLCFLGLFSPVGTFLFVLASSTNDSELQLRKTIRPASRGFFPLLLVRFTLKPHCALFRGCKTLIVSSLKLPLYTSLDPSCDSASFDEDSSYGVAIQDFLPQTNRFLILPAFSYISFLLNPSTNRRQWNRAPSLSRRPMRLSSLSRARQLSRKHSKMCCVDRCVLLF
jgi:hypothetical protein